MYSKLVIYGLASKKIIKEIEVPRDLVSSGENLMEFLRKNEIPIASSCLGDGVCAKCNILFNEEEKLSCQIKIQDVTKTSNEIKIGYL